MRETTKRDTSKRRERILSLLREQGSVQVDQLSQQFHVSTQTIRQDLNFLEKLGTAARSYGGAVLRDGQTPASEAALETKRRLFSAEKVAIGKLAASLIRAGDSVILDSGTTTLQIAAHIPNGTEVTVVTNDLAIANELAGHEGLQLLMLGGALRRKNMSLFGTHAERAVQELSVDKLFLGVDGFDMQKGVTTHFEAEAILNRMMCDAAREVIAVTDSSKFGKVCLHKIIEPGRISKLITDDSIDAGLVKKLTALGVEVLRASR
jgi:DeoR family transcriptional regulator, aga operon transcriptional repressor